MLVDSLPNAFVSLPCLPRSKIPKIVESLISSEVEDAEQLGDTEEEERIAEDGIRPSLSIVKRRTSPWHSTNCTGGNEALRKRSSCSALCCRRTQSVKRRRLTPPDLATRVGNGRNEGDRRSKNWDRSGGDRREQKKAVVCK